MPYSYIFKTETPKVPPPLESAATATCGVPSDKSLFRLGVDPFSGVHLCFLPLCCEDSYQSFKIWGGSFSTKFRKKLCLCKLRRFGL